MKLQEVLYGSRTDGFQFAVSLAVPASVLAGAHPDDALGILYAVALFKAWRFLPLLSRGVSGREEGRRTRWLAVARQVLGAVSPSLWFRHSNLAVALGCLFVFETRGLPAQLVAFGERVSRAQFFGVTGLPAGSRSHDFFAVPTALPCLACSHVGTVCMVSGWRGGCLRCTVYGVRCAFSSVRPFLDEFCPLILFVAGFVRRGSAARRGRGSRARRGRFLVGGRADCRLMAVRGRRSRGHGRVVLFKGVAIVVL